MSPERLVYMANQIGQFFAARGPEKGVDGIVDHLHKFWDPRMRRAIVVHFQSGGEGLDPLPRRAVERLAAEH